MKADLPIVNICGVRINSLTFHQAVEMIVNYVSQPALPHYIVTPNAQHLVLYSQDQRFKEIYDNAFLVVPDGMSIIYASKFLGNALPERVNGTDIFIELCKRSVDIKFRIFLLGGLPGAAEKTAALLNLNYGTNVVGTHCPPYGFENNQSEQNIINEKILNAKPDLLFVALGTPKQEYWIFDNYKKLNVPLTIGIGASFDFVSGFVKRAPPWMQRTGLEWFFRLLTEPRRLWRRYIIGNSSFIYLVIKQRMGLL